jgi:hypothetical protein
MDATATPAVCWSLALFASVSLVALRAPGVICLGAAILLAGIWC